MAYQQAVNKSSDDQANTWCSIGWVGVRCGGVGCGGVRWVGVGIWGVRWVGVGCGGMGCDECMEGIREGGGATCVVGKLHV